MSRDNLAIALRRSMPDDALLMEAWRNQPSTLLFQASPKRPLDQIRAMLEEHSATPVSPVADGRVSWIILCDGKPAGNIQVTINGDYDRRHKNAHLGYMVAEEYQGRGVATEAVQRLCDIAFDPGALDLERIEAVAAVENIASRRVLEKAGFTLEGIRRKLLIISGERVDHAGYSLLKADLQEK